MKLDLRSRFLDIYICFGFVYDCQTDDFYPRHISCRIHKVIYSSKRGLSRLSKIRHTAA